MDLKRGLFEKNISMIIFAFRFFVPPPTISLIGDGWENRNKRLFQFYKDEAKKKKIDEFLMPEPHIDALIGIYDVDDHPVLDFIFCNQTVGQFFQVK